MSIKISQLAIEVTRRCNIRCSHCLRGEQENKNISLSYISDLLDQVNSIGHIAFTGGEPSLNAIAISYTINECKKRNISINTFFITTNGINISDDFVDVCKNLYALCEDKKNCDVQISNDYYHSIEHNYDDTKLKNLPFYSKRYKNDGDNLSNGDKLHKEGRSVKNYPNAKIRSGSATITSIKTFNSNTMYLNVNGDIINGCDWSYTNQDSHKICDVKSLESHYNMIEYVEDCAKNYEKSFS